MSSQIGDILTTAGVTSTLREVSWKRAEERISSGEALSFGWIKTSERQKRWRYSKPVCTLRTVLVTRAAQPVPWDGQHPLQAYKFGWTRAYSYGDALDKIRSTLNVVEMPTEEVALKRLLAGTVNAVPMDSAVAQTLVGRLFTPDQGKQLLIDLDPAHKMYDADTHLVCALSSPTCATTIERFNQALKVRRGAGLVPACAPA
jgi:ABC-type amino acid transport substrate-binding protein